MVIKLLSDTTPLKQRVVMLGCANKDCQFSLQTIEVAKLCTKAQYNLKVHPHLFHEGDIILVYNQSHDILGRGKFKPLWKGPYIIKQCLGKGVYLIEVHEGELLPIPCNALYLKRFHP